MRASGAQIDAIEWADEMSAFCRTVVVTGGKVPPLLRSSNADWRFCFPQHRTFSCLWKFTCHNRFPGSKLSLFSPGTNANLQRCGGTESELVRGLSGEFQSAYRDIHDLVLARSSAGKLAKLLLSWTTGREIENGACEIRIRSSLTHEEMAQMIGSSRETVTRLLSELKKKEFIRLEGSTLVIRNRTALEALAA
jgi:DNA-binding XRE family transcriptional regulator